MIPTTTRNATLNDLVRLLQDQQARKLDVVTPAHAVRSESGILVVSGAEALLTDDGVTTVDGRYRPTAVCDEGVAEKLGIPLSYLRRLRAERPDLYDANVNGWLHGATRRRGDTTTDLAPGDDRSFLLRLFRGDEGEEGIARALLSSKYARIENLDVLMAALDGVRRAGVDADVTGADLSDRRMYVRIAAPEVRTLAPKLLRNYRSPFTGARGVDNPVVFAGIEISNSEVGGGAFTVTPRIVVQVCANGVQITRDVVGAVHLGGRLEDGVIRWTEETQRRSLDLVTSRTRDAVATFLDGAYLERALGALEDTAFTPIGAPADTIQKLSKKLAYDETTAAGILDHFIRGGDVTAGGVLHAVTSFAQTVQDADAANALETSAIRAMELAATG